MTDRLELLAVVALGFLLDQVLGDPHWLYHPVRLIGAYISFLEKGIRKLFGEGESALLAGGVVLVVLVTGTTAVVSGGILYTCGSDVWTDIATAFPKTLGIVALASIFQVVFIVIVSCTGAGCRGCCYCRDYYCYYFCCGFCSSCYYRRCCHYLRHYS